MTPTRAAARQMTRNAEVGRSADVARGPRRLESRSRPRLERLTHLDRRIDELSLTLTSLDSAERDRAIDAALEVLGHGLRAERVAFLESDDPSDPLAASPTPGSTAALVGPASAGRFGTVRDWLRGDVVREGTVDRCEIRFEAIPEAAARLCAGRACELASGLDEADRPESPGGGPGWSSSHLTLLVPCLGPSGLVGLFAIERDRAQAMLGDAEAITRAEWVGRMVAGFLERHRLASALAATRERKARGERLETLGRVASSVAHDFNNVLTAILGFSDLLEIELDERGEGRAELDEIREAASHAADLVDQVLTFARGRDEGEREIELGDWLKRLEGMLGRVVGKENTLALDLGSSPDHRVRVDPGRLERALLNLVANARVAIETRGRPGGVEIGLRHRTLPAGLPEPGDDSPPSVTIGDPRPGRWIELALRDDGCGIEPELLERIFEPFFTTRAHGGGTGLGLATTVELVHEVQGFLRVESLPGEGATFRLFLPAVSGTRLDGFAGPGVGGDVPPTPRRSTHA